MKKLNKWLVALLCASQWAFAEPVAVDFKAATVVDVVQTLVKEVLKRDYVISPDVLQLDRRITVNVRKVDSENLLPLLEGILRTVGIEIADKGGVLYVQKIVPMDSPSAPVAQKTPEVVPVDKGLAGAAPGGQGGDKEFNTTHEIEVYWPLNRGVDILTQAVRLSGAKLLENSDKAGAVVFSGKPETIKRALDLLAKFDRPAAAVNVKAVVIEYTESTEKSTSFQAALSAFSEKLGIVLDAGTRAANTVTLSTTPLKLILSALEGDSRFKYIAEPSIRVMDGEKGKITVGSEVPTRGQVTMDTNGNSLQSIVYKTAGVMFELSPKIYGDTIVLSVNQQISSFTTTTTSGIDSPTVLKRDLQTTLDAKSGDVIVMAGLDESRDSKTHNGFSFLPSFFGGTSTNTARSQILLLLEVNKAGTASKI